MGESLRSEVGSEISSSSGILYGNEVGKLEGYLLGESLGS